MTDADVDGSHIRTLLLTFFFRHMPGLLSNGHLYIAQPPLYRLKAASSQHWVYSEQQKEELMKTELKGAKKVEVQRYKGLGEMNPEQLWDTTMNPDSRLLLRVTLEDAAAADRIFTILMGEDVESRREFIQENAKDVRLLDV